MTQSLAYQYDPGVSLVAGEKSETYYPILGTENHTTQIKPDPKRMKDLLESELMTWKTEKPMQSGY